jgi:hypothetical protein
MELATPLLTDLLQASTKNFLFALRSLSVSGTLYQPCDEDLVSPSQYVEAVLKESWVISMAFQSVVTYFASTFSYMQSVNGKC